jgi:hypothetical protein
MPWPQRPFLVAGWLHSWYLHGGIIIYLHWCRMDFDRSAFSTPLVRAGELRPKHGTGHIWPFPPTLSCMWPVDPNEPTVLRGMTSRGSDKRVDGGPFAGAGLFADVTEKQDVRGACRYDWETTRHTSERDAWENDR